MPVLSPQHKTEQHLGSPTGSTEATIESDLTGRANAAHKAKEAAQAAIADAEATKAAAKDVSNELDDLDLNTFIASRLRRQDSSNTATTYATPVNCDDLKTTMTDLTNAMDSSTPDFGRAKNLVETLTSLDPSSLSPGCLTVDISELEVAKNTAKDIAEAAVATQTNFISAKRNELNALVSLILALNQQIQAEGGTTIDPGTTVSTESPYQPSCQTSSG